MPRPLRGVAMANLDDVTMEGTLSISRGAFAAAARKLRCVLGRSKNK